MHHRHHFRPLPSTRVRWLIAASLGLVLIAGSAASAQSADSLYPARLLDRPTTLPRGASRLDVMAISAHQPGSPDAVSTIVGGGVGITSSVEVGGQFLPVSLSPGAARITAPSVYATYAVSIGRLSVAPTVQAVFPTTTDAPFLFDIGVPLYRSIGNIGYLSMAPTITVDTRQNGYGTTFSVPVTFMRQQTRAFTWQLSSGIGLSRFDPRFGLSRRSEAFKFNQATVPVSLQAMYTITRAGARHPLADVSLQWQWPQLFSDAPHSRQLGGDDWAVQLQVSVYSIR